MTARLKLTIVDTLGLVSRNPKMRLLTGAAQGAAYRIAGAYYDAGCPDYKIDYQAASGLASSLWDKHAEVLLIVLNEVLPELKKLYQEVEGRRVKWKARGQKISEAKRLKNGIKKAKKQFSDQDSSATTGISAIAPPRREFNEGKSDQFERQRIIKQRQEATGNKLFTDG